MNLILRQGDCIERMAEMEANSIGAIVCDPPYGLEFFGCEWDKLEPARNKQRWKGSERNLFGSDDKPEGTKGDGTLWGRMGELPNYVPKRNPKCRICGHYSFSGTPCQCEEPDWDTRSVEHLHFIQAWHVSWLDAGFRVLVPAGQAWVFSGTRTFHRLAAAMTKAGFTDIHLEAWTYGSGFPKSLDVSKALDKNALSIPLFEAIRSHVRKWRDTRGLTNRDLNIAVGCADSGSGMARHWLSEVGGQHSIPSKEMWLRLKNVLQWPDCEFDSLYETVKDGVDRPVVGVHKGAMSGWSMDGKTKFVDRDVTVPATKAAKKWEGFGTALKPAWESIIVGRKPCR